MAAAVRGGRENIQGVIFHSDRGSTCTVKDYTRAVRRSARHPPVDGSGRLVLRQRRRRVVLSTVEREVLSRNEFCDPDHAREVVLEWCHEFYNTTRRHSSVKMMSPIDYETTRVLETEAA